MAERMNKQTFSTILTGMFQMLHHLSADLFPDKLLEGLAVLGKLLDPLVKLVERHLVLEKRPSEFRFVIDEGDLGNGIGLGGYEACRERLSRQ